MIKKVLACFIIFLLMITTGCDITGNTIVEDSENFLTSDLPLKIAKLEPLNLSSVDNFEKYQTFTDYTNNLIKIINEKEDLFNVPFLSSTQESWEKISKTITKWGPLIGNYNEVVLSAKCYENEPTEDNIKEFYLASSKFSLETALISWSVFYGFAFTSVGVVYRAVGLNKFAAKCPICVSATLSSAHWFIREVLINGSSWIADLFIRGLRAFQGI